MQYVVSCAYPVVDDHWYTYPHAHNYRIKAFSWPKAHALKSYLQTFWYLTV